MTLPREGLAPVGFSANELKFLLTLAAFVCNLWLKGSVEVSPEAFAICPSTELKERELQISAKVT